MASNLERMLWLSAAAICLYGVWHVIADSAAQSFTGTGENTYVVPKVMGATVIGGIAMLVCGHRAFSGLR